MVFPSITVPLTYLIIETLYYIILTYTSYFGHSFIRVLIVKTAFLLSYSIFRISMEVSCFYLFLNFIKTRNTGDTVGNEFE